MNCTESISQVHALFYSRSDTLVTIFGSERLVNLSKMILALILSATMCVINAGLCLILLFVYVWEYLDFKCIMYR